MIGETLSHYRIVRRIGGGGMGVVYEAEDLFLGRRVAVKVLPEGIGDDPSMLERFRREARTASALNHPNICTIHEIGSQEGRPFLVMELLRGETLKRQIGGRPLPSHRVLELGVQVSEALVAAHAEGIVHRDIKPANIFINERGQAKLLDFGLAKLQYRENPPKLEDLSDQATATFEEHLTSPGSMIGTVAYMSPEQARGRPLDIRTDLFSFGAVLYEMTTGELPFRGNTAAEIFDGILNRDPTPATELNPETPLALQDILIKALQKDPGRRYQDAAEIRADLVELVHQTTVGRRSAGRMRLVSSRWLRRVRLRWALAVLAGLVTALVLVLWLRDVRRPDAGATPPAVTVEVSLRRSVAVLGFKNLSGRPEVAWMSTALSEMLTTELAAGRELRTVSGESVARLKADLALAEAESLAPDTLARIHAYNGSDYVVVGSYLVVGEGAEARLRLDARIQDTAAGTTVGAVSVSGAQGDLLELLARSGRQLRGELGVGAVPKGEVSALQAALPAGDESAQLYAMGLEALRRSDHVRARDLLERAVTAEPDHPMAHAALAEAWATLGFETQARESASRAFDHSAKLPGAERLWVEGRYREMEGEWDRAIEIYRALLEDAPDDLERGLRLVTAQRKGGRAPEALATLERLRALPQPLGEDPRLDLAEAETAEVVGDFEQMRVAAARAATRAQVRGARLLQARALFRGAWAAWRLGDADEALRAAEQAREIYQTAGDRNGVALALNVVASVQWAQGHLDTAADTYRTALDISRGTGSRPAEGVLRNNLALVLQDQGNLAAARDQYERALHLDREMSDRRGAAIDLGNLAGLQMRMGDLRASRASLDEALAFFRETGDRDGEAHAWTTVGDLAWRQGRIAEAREALEKALTIFRATSNRSSTANALGTLGEVRLREGDASGARRCFVEALAIQEALEETGAVTRIQLAWLALEEGRGPEAEAEALRAREALAERTDRRGEIESRAVLAEALLAQGRIHEAGQELAAAVAALDGSQDLVQQFRVALTRARVEAASGEHAAAGRRLGDLISRASEKGFVAVQLDARLLLGELELGAGLDAAGRARLVTLDAEARAAGFGLVARKATRALARSNREAQPR